MLPVCAWCAVQIIVLILSQDTSFSHNIHKVHLPGAVPWSKERLLTRISLGSLVYVVLLRWGNTTQRRQQRSMQSDLKGGCVWASYVKPSIGCGDVDGGHMC